MKPSIVRRLALAAVFFSPLAAFAHPGHDGGHDLEWDTSHFAAHPVATLLGVGVLAAGIWTVVQLIRSRRAKDETVVVRVKTRR
jgi:hydrogenase/urease accessory protein HupE